MTRRDAYSAVGIALSVFAMFIGMSVFGPIYEESELLKRSGEAKEIVRFDEIASFRRRETVALFGRTDDDVICRLRAPYARRLEETLSENDFVLVLCERAVDVGGMREVYELTINGQVVLDYETTSQLKETDKLVSIVAAIVLVI